MNTQSIENRIASRIVGDALARGYEVSVHDGEVTTVRRATEAATILAALRTTEADTLLFHRPGAEKKSAWVLLIWENAEDVVSDSSDSSETDMLLAGAETIREFAA